MLPGEAVMINRSDVALEHRRAYYAWHAIHKERHSRAYTSAGVMRNRRGRGGVNCPIRPNCGAEERLGIYLKEVALPRVIESPEITGAHWLVADKTASGIVSVERQGRPTVVPQRA